MLRDVFYYGKKPNVHPREKFATSIEDARSQCTTEHFWIINEYCDYRNFDWDWDFEFLPDEDVWAEEHNNVWPSQHQKDSGTWLCPKQYSEIIVYRADVDIVKHKNEKNDNWVLLDLVDEIKFDFSWHPDPTDPPFIYTWGCKFFPVELQPCLEYHVNGATIIKYMDTIVELLPYTERWVEVQEVDKTKFDMSWRPDPREPIMNYVWGNKYIDGELKSTLEYHVPGATDTKYMTDFVPVMPEWDRWVEVQEVDKTKFDFSWRPDPREPAYIYVWGNKWISGELKSTLEYHVPGAVDIKYMADFVPVMIDKDRWVEVQEVDKTKFDMSWRPDPREPAYIYVWGNKWISGELKSTLEYHMPEATSTKYMTDFVPVMPEWDRWAKVKEIDKTKFDFSWRPDPREPAFIYQFGTLIDKEDGPKYVHPTATDDVIVYLERIDIPQPKIILQYTIQTTLEDLIKQHPDEIFWALHDKIDYTNFNFEWRPEIVNIQWENEYVYVFGSPDSEITQTYFVNAGMYLKGYTDFKFIQTEELTESYLATLFKKSDMFFIDRSNSESTLRFDVLKQKFPNLQKTRYLNSWVETINRCTNRSTTELCWILNSELDYTEFDFEYYPNQWQMKMVHVFGTQWSHWGTTFMVNCKTFAEDTKYIKVIEHLSNLNFVKQRRAKATNILYDIVYIDHGNKDLSNVNNLIVKYEKSYLNTFKNMLGKLPVKKEHYVWIASTICDYTDFDFTYICDPFAKEQLHVFPSDRQKFGDTFLIEVNKLRSLISDIKTLEDFNKINFNQSQRVKRLPAPIIISEGDSHVSSINTEFNFPYAVFVTEDNKNNNVVDIEPMNVWSNETKNITITSKGGTRIVVPKEAKQYVKKELYDYPYIITGSKLIESNPLDIIFFSNGETSADKNYEHLLKITYGLPNKVIRIDGVNGRVKSQHAAANSSNTAWYFLVNAKLKVASKFDFNWQPDRLQISKHYIFHATNPVNELVYGHQAIVANNKKLTLENFGTGLDFTMDSEHEVVPANSGIGMYNSSEWDTWRTAFRECIKLKASGTTENDIRLTRWLNVGLGDFSDYSLQGAKHAIEYYEEVDGNFDKLRLSYDWGWLRTHYETKYK